MNEPIFDGYVQKEMTDKVQEVWSSANGGSAHKRVWDEDKQEWGPWIEVDSQFDLCPSCGAKKYKVNVKCIYCRRA